MKEKELHNDNQLKKGNKPCALILYNDDINTFEHVIASLVEICGHDPVQAEQCAMIVHFKGSCEIKNGAHQVLASMRKALNAKGLIAKVRIGAGE
jgi:ATP-dependent Clp protease adaptor protein ClpS